MIDSRDRPWGIAVDPDDGDLFVSEDFAGALYRSAADGSDSGVHVLGFDGTDDDTAGITIVPETYTGGVVAPGSGLVTDRGFNSSEEIWLFDPDTAEGEVELFDTITANDGFYDITANDTRIFVINFGVGLIEVLDDPDDTPFAVMLGTPVTGPSDELLSATSGAFDPISGHMFVTLDDASNGDANSRIVRVDVDTGEFVDVVTGLDRASFASLDVSANGDRLFVSDVNADAIYTFALNIPSPASGVALVVGVIPLVVRRRRRCHRPLTPPPSPPAGSRRASIAGSRNRSRRR